MEKINPIVHRSPDKIVNYEKGRHYYVTLKLIAPFFQLSGLMLDCRYSTNVTTMCSSFVLLEK